MAAEANLLGVDSFTSGSWRARYGRSGYYVNNTVSLVQPSWLTSAGNNGTSAGWTPSVPAGPFAGYSGITKNGGIFSTAATTTLTFTVSDTAWHIYSIYLWEGSVSPSRAMKVDITDSSNTVLATYTSPIALGPGLWVSFAAKESINVLTTNTVAGSSFNCGVWFDEIRSYRLGLGGYANYIL